jgi:hypothetical protein
MPSLGLEAQEIVSAGAKGDKIPLLVMNIPSPQQYRFLISEVDFVQSNLPYGSLSQTRAMILYSY